jgi:hypothetical protein
MMQLNNLVMPNVSQQQQQREVAMNEHGMIAIGQGMSHEP